MTTEPAYTLHTTLDRVTPGQLQGFFVDWPNPPAPETFLRLLRGSYRVVLAVHDGQVIGFVQAISDGVLTAYIPLLEVLPAWQGRGVGRALMTRMQAELRHLYAVDLGCDDNLVPYYEALGMRRGNLMFTRNYARQDGSPTG
ncbi:GNAT family N-acetyltransferase [Deinococcus indicus]|uniref:GNAT family N-acetyltransferase n=1 Tax=Deinococcus indicus TaxID=223556 RepID=UPI0019C81920|nr:GNAT family N-acetyltransferase [Deinococcus indicus]GHG17817.1 N-acetyltransferase [Deinococcus indicus]